jgi:hypothetical protein
VRRIVAVTGSEAEAAIKEGDRLSSEVEAAGQLTDVAALEGKVSALKQVRELLPSGCHPWTLMHSSGQLQFFDQ